MSFSMKKIIHTKFFQRKDAFYHGLLTRNVILITGASRGIGKAIAEQFLQENATVVLVSRNLEDLKKTFEKHKDEQMLLLEADISQEKDVKKIIQAVIQKYGKIDLLVNNAGIFSDKPLDQTTVEEFDRMITTNIKGVFLMTKEVIPHMKKVKNGLIVNIGSKISHNTNVTPNKVLYATTKYALEGFSFALHKELKEFGIRVTCLMPGTVNTFISLKGKDYMSPSDISQIIELLFRFKHIQFESIVFKSKFQDI